MTDYIKMNSITRGKAYKIPKFPVIDLWSIASPDEQYEKLYNYNFEMAAKSIFKIYM